MSEPKDFYVCGEKIDTDTYYNFNTNILGVKYDVLYETKEQNKKLKDCGGYCDYSNHTCHIRLVKEDIHTVEDLKKTLCKSNTS